MRISTKTWGSIVYLWFALRVVLPLVIFINPVAGQIVSMALDAPDGYFTFKSKKSWEWYHRKDKIADYWWYILIVIYTYYAHLPILAPIVLLFLYRSVGQFLTLKKQESWLLIFFPNILENYFIAYLIFGNNILDKQFSLYIWSACIVIAVFREYLLHIKKAYAVNYLFKLGVNWNKNKK